MLLPKRSKTYSSSFLLLTKLKCQHTTHRHRGLKPERRQTGKKLRLLRSDRQHVVFLPHISRLNTKKAGRPKMSMVYQRIFLPNICSLGLGKSQYRKEKTFKEKLCYWPFYSRRTLQKTAPAMPAHPQQSSRGDLDPSQAVREHALHSLVPWQ